MGTERGQTQIEMGAAVSGPEMVAEDALSRGDLSEASVAYRNALTADPTDNEARARFADTLSILNRFDEAIPLYEQLVGTTQSRSDLLLSSLAQAYLGVGDEHNARRVLGMSGMSDDRIAAEVGRLREVNRRRR